MEITSHRGVFANLNSMHFEFFGVEKKNKNGKKPTDDFEDDNFDWTGTPETPHMPPDNFLGISFGEGTGGRF